MWEVHPQPNLHPEGRPGLSVMMSLYAGILTINTGIRHRTIAGQRSFSRGDPICAWVKCEKEVGF
jgi:hypothetical protein